MKKKIENTRTVEGDSLSLTLSLCNACINLKHCCLLSLIPHSFWHHSFGL